jgi:hypothetical protein
MQMSADDIKEYPEFYNYVRTILPAVRNSEAKIGWISTIAGSVRGENPFDEENIKDALIWGKGPLIKVARMLNYGKYVARKNPNLIYIRRKWVKEYEEGGGKRLTKNGQPVDLVEVILLHELTHWADYQDGKANKIEVGDWFEEEYYGHIITHRSTIPA